jgi:serine protease Do
MYRTKTFWVIIAVQLFLTGFVNQSFCSETSRSQRRTPIVEVYEKTRDTVVNISGVRQVSTSAWGGYDWPDLFDFWGPRFKREISVLGSGVVVHESGYLITNAHVVKEAQNIKAIFNNGDEFPCTIIKADEGKDLALLKIQADKKLPFVHLGSSDDLMIGETVVAIGNPYGYSNTLTTGVISAVGRDIPVQEGHWLRGLIQTDAPINPGNSGGPLFNINGDLIGINTAIRAGAENIGFAIPVDTLADNLAQMLMPEKLRRVRLGLVVGRIKTTGRQTGLVIDSVIEPSPAHDKGLAAGDIILQMDGHKLANIIDFYVRMISKEVGEPITIEYIRPGSYPMRSRKVQLSMLVRPLPDGRELCRRFFQMDISELNEAIASKFGYESAYPILIITAVHKRGMAETVGLEPGDLILSINNVYVRNTKELSIVMENISEGDLVEMTILRFERSYFGQVRRQYTVRLKAQLSKSDRL